MNITSEVQRCIEFLQDIGLVVHLANALPQQGFVDNIALVSGEIYITPACRFSPLLHEAGHLAICPTRYRHLLSGNLYAGMKQISKELTALKLEPDSPLDRAFIQCGDSEATAWAWAAGLAIGLSAQCVIEDADYQGDGASIRDSLRLNSYLGIHGLMHSGMTLNPRRGGFPAMLKWLQDADVQHPPASDAEKKPLIRRFFCGD